MLEEHPSNANASHPDTMRTSPVMLCCRSLRLRRLEKNSAAPSTTVPMEKFLGSLVESLLL